MYFHFDLKFIEFVIALATLSVISGALQLPKRSLASRALLGAFCAVLAQAIPVLSG